MFGQYAAQDRVFDMNYLIDNMREQLTPFYQVKPTIKPLQMTLVEDKNGVADHYKIVLGDLFNDELRNFFANNGVKIRTEMHSQAGAILRIRKDELANSALTYRKAHDFLGELHTKCEELRFAEHQAKPC